MNAIQAGVRLISTYRATTIWASGIAAIMLIAAHWATPWEAGIGLTLVYLGVGMMQVWHRLSVVHAELAEHRDALLERIDQLTAALIDARIPVPDNPRAVHTISARKGRR